ncbi:Low molecular weight phosphotyrosine protein phosphatase [Sorochytrium milnesiophthora]
MCEAVFAHMVQERGLMDFEIDSAGTAGYHTGEQPDDRSVATCQKHGVSVNHRARQVTAADFSHYDYVLCMDKSNLSDLQRIQPKKSKAVLKMFGEYDPQGDTIIADPYYGGIDGFEHNFQQAERCSRAFLESLGY